jgi:hypothetical protein
MANTYTWVISQLDCYPTQDNKTDVVFTVHWRRQATDGSGHNGDIYGSQAITLNPDETFVPYANLTQAEVIGWLEAAMGAETLAAQEAALDKQIADQINPPTTSPPLPWVTAPTQ